jgi:xanthine dehydrogenase YagR molybdenum-binding subunit
MTTAQTAVGESVTRLEGRLKITGQARYAAEIPAPGLAHGWIVPAQIAPGRVRAIDVDAVLAMPGVLSVLYHGNAPRLTDAGDATLPVLQEDRVPHRAGRSRSSSRRRRNGPAPPPRAST